MYKIGTLNIQINHLQNSQLVERLAIFHSEEGTPDIQYNISYVTEFEMPSPKDIVYESSTLIIAQKNDTKQYYHVYRRIPYAMVEVHSKSQYHIFLLTELLHQNAHPYFLPELLHLEQGLMQKNSIVFHSSYIAVEDGAILFTAPSGGGKSTQAELWKEHQNAKIINGDKSIISKEQNVWNVYGIPFSGSSAYCCNESFPLKAIVILDKGPEDYLLQIGLRGFANVFSQVTVNLWDEEFCSKAMDLVFDLCREIPIYYYKCTKNQSAVEVLLQELHEKGIING